MGKTTVVKHGEQWMVYGSQGDGNTELKQTKEAAVSRARSRARNAGNKLVIKNADDSIGKVENPGGSTKSKVKSGLKQLGSSALSKGQELDQDMAKAHSGGDAGQLPFMDGPQGGKSEEGGPTLPGFGPENSDQTDEGPSLPPVMGESKDDDLGGPSLPPVMGEPEDDDEDDLPWF